jgi:hypothetical protein
LASAKLAFNSNPEICCSTKTVIFYNNFYNRGNECT